MFRWFLIVSVLLIIPRAFAVDEYSTASDGEKKLIKQIVEVLKLEPSTEVEKKIYDRIDFVFDTKNWNSYWLGYNDLESSKIKDPGVTFVEQYINTSDIGTFIIGFLYDKEAKQILVTSKQIRYASKDIALDAFKTTKADEEKFSVLHETANYALLQEKGKVSYSNFHIGGNAGIVVYIEQGIIDL